MAVFVAYVVALVLLLATDLDQRLLPDLITLPMIVVAFAFAISGQNPLVGGAWPAALAAALVIPAVLYLLSLLFGAGAFGLGDVKLLVSVGLMSGAYRAILGTVAGTFLAGIVIVVLLVDPPGQPQDLHPVRAVPDPRAPSGRSSLRPRIERPRSGLDRAGV